MSTISERLRVLRGEQARRAFAETMDIPPSTLKNYELGDTSPSLSTLELICEKLFVSPQWLLLGNGPMFTTEEVEKIPARAGILRAGDPIATYRAVAPKTEEPARVVNAHAPEAIEAPSHQIIMIPMVEARLSAGHGSFETDGTVERKYSFRSDFLRRKGNISEMVLMRVDGDSMTPEVKDGDVVLVDQSQKSPRAGCVYAVGVEDVVYLKMLNTQPGKIVLSSFNLDYPPFEIDARGDLSEGVRIIGRVVWSCREW